MIFRLITFFVIISMVQLNAQKDSLKSKLQFEMDFRFRAEQDWDSQKSDGSFREDRSRLRYRFRTGLSYAQDWYTFGFRIRTGDPNKQQDPQLTLGKGLKEYGTLPLGFEKIYFQSEWNDFKLCLGKNSYPFTKNNELFWSDNVFPEGISIKKKINLKSPLLNEIELSGGHFVMASNNTSFNKDAYFQAFQTSFTGWDKRIMVFPSLYVFRNIPDIPDGDHSFLLDYTIMHFGSSLKLLKDHSFRIDFDYYQNFENYESNIDVASNFTDQRNGFVVGLKYGDLKVADNWFFSISYADLERYSIVDYMAQNDWARWDYSAFNSPDGRLSNFRGAEIVAAYAISDKINIVSKYYIVEQLIPYGTSKETGQRIRFDINVKF